MLDDAAFGLPVNPGHRFAHGPVHFDELALLPSGVYMYKVRPLPSMRMSPIEELATLIIDESFVVELPALLLPLPPQAATAFVRRFQTPVAHQCSPGC